MKRSLSDIQKEYIEFRRIRGWKLEDPNMVLGSLIVELGELAEHFQWKHKKHEMSEEDKTSFGYEFVDVLNYLMAIADIYDIDIQKYWEMKMPKLKEKFPLGKESLEANKEYRKLGKNKLYK